MFVLSRKTVAVQMSCDVCPFQSDEETHFVKVHAPYEVLTRYAEILKMKMKMKQVCVEYPQADLGECPDVLTRVFSQKFH